MSDGDTYELKDPRALRALTHPLRGKLLVALRVDGPATASMLARRYDENSAATSYHLRILADYGFVEDDPEHRNGGRERWWRAAHSTTRWSPETFFDGTPGGTDAVRQFLARLGGDYQAYYARWLEELDTWSDDWQGAALTTDRFLDLTPRQLAGLRDELEQTVQRYIDAGPDGDGAERVAVLMHAFPQRGPLP